MTRSKQISRIAVIGAGPTGLAAAKYLLAEKYFEKIDVFEQRAVAGGVWNYSPPSLKDQVPRTVPQLDPHQPLQGPIWHTVKGGEEPVFVSPIYRDLETNLPKEIMRYSDKLFKAKTQVLPKHATVKEYLQEYAEEIRHLIQFETQVSDVRKEVLGEGSWSVTTRSLRTGDTKTNSYDAVVVASGHYDLPFTPDIPGITHWNETYPGVISHSKLYDCAEQFRDKKVVVVGSSASGLDISNQILPVSKGKVIVSERNQSLLASAAGDTSKVYRPQIVEFLPSDSHSRAVRFEDGHVEENIDAIVFCTGYLYTFPFLSSLDPPLITNGRRVVNTYQHLFYIHDPTLVLTALPQRVVPFPLSENQAAVFARVFSGRLSLPSPDAMNEWEQSTVREKGEGTPFHLLPFPQDADMMNFLHDWAKQAEPRPGLDHGGHGKPCNDWGERERWIRAQIADIKRAFGQKGAERGLITSLAQLGFDYDRRDEEEKNPSSIHLG
ncbi:putative flavin dependent monooxygenase [Aspergillus saccharolyticus JOP 1030-1]|uniref:FAD/NAD(P)-binding domain-containing protein n=1 Tax=Aspergillus saccharolyticus JOP 1030-1 TaxID=1450539 RepID=A0A318Z605_9EURO|nr:FAD/NAD(P)-binding domain-containing protein [Aspergillus saccharolyticus JOP 1030-1]PYH42705.1 FAD/NAD(P)-binding domain-containing protein [Aspergillus saccharolyticus JOP 1030-1]